VQIAELRLVNFRSYDDIRVSFAPGLNVIVGPNASGKTNLLEGAFFALRAVSCRTNREEKAVRWGASFTRIEATLEMGPAGGPALPGQDPGAARQRTASVAYAPGQAKQIRLDGAEVSSLDELRRQGNVFVFVPESLLLVKGSPARRRAHLDAFATGVDPAYAAALRDLQEALRQRNAQLARVREGADPTSLDPWDRQVARAGLELASRRRSLVAALAVRFAGYAAALAPAGGAYELALISQLDDIADSEDAFVAALVSRRRGDVARAVTCFGPQRDDLRLAEVLSEEAGERALRDLRLFGSQGEQRAAVLALLLAQRAVAAELTGDFGTLLLDDVMSELDNARRRLLVRTLSAGGQALVTTTNRHYFTDAELTGAHVVSLGPDTPDE
jgi:DNA replication and repair protein RecF